MTKVRCLILLLISVMLILVLPNISNAATEYKYSDVEQGIEWVYEIDGNENIINLRCTTTTKTGAVTIPSTIEGKTVISLCGNYGKGAFQDFSNVTEITIPNTITTIGQYAFYNCVGLKNVIIPNSVTKIDIAAFSRCSGIETVTLSENLTSIGSSAFANCTGLKSIIIPNSVISIGKSAFENCSKLEELKLPENITKIEQSTFEGCSKLTTVIIPNNVTTIEGSDSFMYGAFQDCINLEKVLIPDSVKSIANTAFENCDKLIIYGNDNQASKDYAESKGISFDYIANWDRENAGLDITAPTVESIEVSFASVMNCNRDTNKKIYIVPTDTKLVINANFSEKVAGTTVPKLTIKFGEGENIEITEGTINGAQITYDYMIKNTDKGTMSLINFEGGNITDEAGNKATLSCPELCIEHDALGYQVYANGTVIDVEDGNNNNNNNDNNDNNNPSTDDSNKPADDNNNPPADDSNKPTDSNKPADTTTKSDTTKKEDNTTATGKLPQTGLTMGVTLAIIAVLAGGVFAYFKYSKLRGI